MLIHRFSLKHPIRWAISHSDPAFINVGARSGLAVVNPLLNPHVFPDRMVRHLHEEIGSCIGETAFLGSSLLAFVETAATTEPTSDWLRRLLGLWRHASGQPELRTTELVIQVQFGSQQLDLPSVHHPRDADLVKGLVPRRHHDCCLTLQHVTTVAGLPLDFTPPVFDTLLTDASRAGLEADYRHAILYAAMAVEVLARVHLDELYEQLLASPRPGNAFRVHDVSMSNGQLKRTDPVYDVVANGTDFKRLLHERPLYLLGRSLLVEKKPLFDLATRLYQTWNKIVHEGEPPETATHCLPLDRDGASQALRCASSVFAWFGKTGTVALPTFDHVEASVFDIC
jgi:hypothetical protein